MLRFLFLRPVWAFCLISFCSGAICADDFLPVGGQAKLSVEYIFESTGKTEDKYNAHEWRVKRVANIEAELSAQAASAFPSLQEPDAKQQAEIESKATRGQAVATEMAPMIASIESIMAKCGDDDDCIEAAVEQMGYGMSDSPELERMQEVGKDVADISRTGPPRYQVLRSVAQSGTYLIDDTSTEVYAEAGMGGCDNLPTRRCTRTETRQGSGPIPMPTEADSDVLAASLPGAVEWDAEKHTLTVILPRPGWPLPYAEVVKSDDPDPQRAGGMKEGLLSFRVSAEGDPEPYTLAVSGNWRQQSGEQLINLPGKGSEGGTLTVRWRLEPM